MYLESSLNRIGLIKENQAGRLSLFLSIYFKSSFLFRSQVCLFVYTLIFRRFVFYSNEVSPLFSVLWVTRHWIVSGYLTFKVARCNCLYIVEKFSDSSFKRYVSQMSKKNSSETESFVYLVKTHVLQL